MPDTTKFPNGISGTADQVHNLGLKIGIYSSKCPVRTHRVLAILTDSDVGAGETTCAGYPASLEHEDTDAETFAEWGIDCEYSRVISLFI